MLAHPFRWSKYTFKRAKAILSKLFYGFLPKLLVEELSWVGVQAQCKLATLGVVYFDQRKGARAPVSLVEIHFSARNRKF